MMISQNGAVRAKILSGQPVYGIWSLIMSSACTEIMAQSGLDFIILDGEHGTASLSLIEENARVVNGSNCDVFVRISTVDAVEIQRVLDIGVQGIVVPQVRTRQDVESVVQCTRLAPEGKRGFNPFTRAGLYRGNAKSVFFRNDHTIVGVLIENADALQNIDEILEVRGLDLIYIGVYDLSCSLGVPGEVDNAKVLASVKSVIEKSVKKNIMIGMMVDSRESSVPYISTGVNFFVFKPDTYVFSNAIGSILK